MLATVRAKCGKLLACVPLHWYVRPRSPPAAAAHPCLTANLSYPLRNTMRRLLLASLSLTIGILAVGLSSTTAADKDKDAPSKDAPIVKPLEGKSETIKLFNGKDLDGWECNKDLWSVEDGEIVGKNKDEIKVSTRS